MQPLSRQQLQPLASNWCKSSIDVASSDPDRNKSDETHDRQEKLKRILEDDMQWSKLQNSLRREIGGVQVNTNAVLLTRNGRNNKLLDEIIDRRFNEMQRLERAVTEAEKFKKQQGAGDGEEHGEIPFLKKAFVKAAEHFFLHPNTESDGTDVPRLDDNDSTSSVRDMRVGKTLSQQVFGWDDSFISESSSRGKSSTGLLVSFRDDSIFGLSSSDRSGSSSGSRLNVSSSSKLNSSANDLRVCLSRGENRVPSGGKEGLAGLLSEMKWTEEDEKQGTSALNSSHRSFSEPVSPKSSTARAC